MVNRKIKGKEIGRDSRGGGNILTRSVSHLRCLKNAENMSKSRIEMGPMGMATWILSVTLMLVLEW